MVVLEQITIEGFRGFCKKVVFDFASHATILGGPNGSGKTSVFDALEWAVLGRVARLAGTRDFVLAGNVERNVFSSNSTVTATFSTEAGKLELHKSSDSHRALLSGNPVRFDEVYRALGIDADDPVGAFLRVHLLEQHSIAHFVDERPRDRYEDLKSLGSLLETEQVDKHLLGTLDNALRGAQIELTTINSSLARESALLRQTTSDIAHLESRMVEASDFTVDQLTGEEASLLAQIVASETLDLPGVERADAALPGLLRKQDELKGQLEFLEAVTASFGGDQALRGKAARVAEALGSSQEAVAAVTAQLQALRSKRDLLLGQLRTVDSRLQELQRHQSDIRSLLQGITRHITEDRCPVCLREIEAGKLMEIVREQIAAGPVVPIDLVKQRENLEADLKKFNLEETQLADIERQNRSSYEALLNDNNLIHKELLGFELRERRALQIVGKPDLSVADLKSALESSAQQLDSTRQWIEKINALQARKILMNERSLLSEKRQDRGKLEVTVASLKKRVERLNNGVALLNSTREIARRAQVELTRRTLKIYEPLIADLYNRIRPHRVFHNFEMEVIPAYKEGELFLHAKSEDGVSIQIPAVFSMTQRNAVALCFFLALNLSLGSARTIALIDDPIHSMDDINALGLADLFRQLKGMRQLVFSTHDRRLFDLFLDKLGRDSDQGSVVGYWFDSWGRLGPQVTKELPPGPARALAVEEIVKLLPAA